MKIHSDQMILASFLRYKSITTFSKSDFRELKINVHISYQTYENLRYKWLFLPNPGIMGGTLF